LPTRRLLPLIAKNDVSKKMLGDLKERAFGGSAELVMLSLFDLDDVDEAEIKRLRRMLNQKLRERSQ
jgi:BlaI family penicillinase repressor